MISICPQCHAANRLPAERLGQNARCARCKQAISPPSLPIELGSTDDFQELISKAPVPVLVDFWAEWCGPCRTVAPELKKVALQTPGRLIVAKVNTETLGSVAAQFRIESIPTMVLFKAGHEAQRLSGAQPAGSILRALQL